MNLMIGDAVKFILANRKGNAFKNYTEEQLVITLQQTISDGWLPYAVDTDGSIVGIACCFVRNGQLEVENMLATQKWVLKAFFKKADELFPGMLFNATHKGKAKTRSINKIAERL